MPPPKMEDESYETFDTAREAADIGGTNQLPDSSIPDMELRELLAEEETEEEMLRRAIDMI